MNTLGPEHIFSVYRVHPQQDGTTKRQLAGRYIEHGGEVHVLEDYFGVLGHLPEGPITDQTNRVLAHLRRSSYLDVVSSDDHARRFDLLPVHDFGDPSKESQAQFEGRPAAMQQTPTQPTSIFEYFRDGQTHTVEFRNGQCYLDGQQLDPAEAQRLLEHHRQGVAVIHYVRGKDGGNE